MPCFCPLPVWRKEYSFWRSGPVFQTKFSYEDILNLISNAQFIYDDDGQHIEEVVRDDIRGTDLERDFKLFLKYFGVDSVYHPPSVCRGSYINFLQGGCDSVELTPEYFSREWVDRYKRYLMVKSMSQVEVQRVQQFMERFDLIPIKFFPCGFCESCLSRFANEWGMRCDLEMRSHKFNCFITLTYDDDHIVLNHSVYTDHLQKFWKRLRMNLVRKESFRFLLDSGCDPKFKYFASGEYGSKPNLEMRRPFGRPHYHAIIFGLDFLDKRRFNKSSSGFWQCTSDLLSECWDYGFATVGESANFCTARYVAKYIQKEMFIREFNLGLYRDKFLCNPPFTTSSNRPGIGARYFEEHLGKDLYVNIENFNDFDRIIGYGGKKYRLPRYFYKLLKKAVDNGKFDPEIFRRYTEFREAQISNSLYRSLPYNLYAYRSRFLSGFELNRDSKRRFAR